MPSSPSSLSLWVRRPEVKLITLLVLRHCTDRIACCEPREQSSSSFSAARDDAASLSKRASDPFIPDEYFEVQLESAAHRAAIVSQWDIPVGARVLEIGCGQGDTTAVLAELVGENGHVTGVDPASLDYGASCCPELQPIVC